ncbi:MAG: hypothetical protein BWY76_03002 [bacterium ADurb.Bin429]|nr:MAG: hypothetical protein BWY76_03002 [bacterium ADurb.Bin429]
MVLAGAGDGGVGGEERFGEKRLHGIFPGGDGGIQAHGAQFGVQRLHGQRAGLFAGGVAPHAVGDDEEAARDIAELRVFVIRAPRADIAAARRPRAFAAPGLDEQFFRFLPTHHDAVPPRPDVPPRYSSLLRAADLPSRASLPLPRRFSAWLKLHR